MINRKYINTLELPKILHMLTEQISCIETKKLIEKLEPSTDFNTIERLLKITSDAHMLTARYGSPTIHGVSDYNDSLKRAELGGALSTKELLGICGILRSARVLADYRKRCDNIDVAFDFAFESLYCNKFLQESIDNTILSEDQIADNASPALADIRRKIRGCESQVRQDLDKMIHSHTYQKYLQDAIVTMRDGRFVVPVKAEYRSEIKGLIHDTSGSGATIFVEPMSVVETNNKLRLLLLQEKDEISRILAELSAQCGEVADNIIGSFDAILQLDLIFAKSKLAYLMKASVPMLNTDGVINLKNARHPLIGKEKVVPTNISLGTTFDTLVITGPNTGGKTVALKTLGLLSLMTYCGLMIPCEHGSEIAVFEQIFADIGDEQSIEQSLSTFSSHMTNIVGIMQSVDDQTLVLLDELGAGTDPTEGAALAVAILEHLRGAGAKIAATTHYAELKVFALQTQGVENACCEFDVSTLRPTYKLLIGVPGRSNAFLISSALGLEDTIIERAKQHMDDESHNFENVIQKLENTRIALEEELRQAQNETQTAIERQRELEEFKAKIQSEKDNQILQARYEAKKIVESTTKQASEIIMELDMIRKEKNAEAFSELALTAKSTLKNKIAKLNSIADPVEKNKNANYSLPRKIRIGDDVLIVDIDKCGTVVDIPNKPGKLIVKVGIVKMAVNSDNVRLLTGKDSSSKGISAPRKIKHQVESRSTRKVVQEIDLRGLDSEEAILQLSSFIDNAFMSGITHITVIHGKGTGVLRSACSAYLRKHKYVRTFRLGVYGEGESGVTIVELK